MFGKCVHAWENAQNWQTRHIAAWILPSGAHILGVLQKRRELHQQHLCLGLANTFLGKRVLASDRHDHRSLLLLNRDSTENVWHLDKILTLGMWANLEMQYEMKYVQYAANMPCILDTPDSHHIFAIWCCREAVNSQSQSAYAVPAKHLDKLLAQLEDALMAAALPIQHQHWVMYTALSGYLCSRQCYAVLGDRLRLQQVPHPTYAFVPVTARRTLVPKGCTLLHFVFHLLWASLRHVCIE